MTGTLIVGGGVYGAAVAWHLAARGEEVCLVEACQIGAGASGGPGRRGVRANYRDHRELPLMIRAREIWPSLHERLGTPPLFERTGQLTLIERDMDLPEARVRAGLQSRLGVSTRVLSGDELRELEPDVAPAIQAAVYCPDDGVADHGATTRAYAEAAQAAGAEVLEGVSVRRVLAQNGRATAVETAAGDQIDLPGNLLLLANAGVPELVRPWIELPTWNLPFQILMSRPLVDNPVRHLVGHAHRTLSLKRGSGGSADDLWRPCRTMGQRASQRFGDPGRGRRQPGRRAGGLSCLGGARGRSGGCRSSGSRLDRRHSAHRPGTGPAQRDLRHRLERPWLGHRAAAVAELLAGWCLDSARPALLAPFSVDRFG